MEELFVAKPVYIAEGKFKLEDTSEVEAIHNVAEFVKYVQANFDTTNFPVTITAKDTALIEQLGASAKASLEEVALKNAQ